MSIKTANINFCPVIKRFEDSYSKLKMLLKES